MIRFTTRCRLLSALLLFDVMRTESVHDQGYNSLSTGDIGPRILEQPGRQPTKEMQEVQIPLRRYKSSSKTSDM